MKRSRPILPFLLLVFVAFHAFGQFSSSIRGQVIDPSGGTVPRASVSIKNAATGISESAVTDDNGNYVLTSLAPGDYQIAVSAPGFRPAMLKVTLETAQTLDVPLQLALLSSSQAIEVTSQAPLLNTDDSRIQSTLGSHELESLPLQGRTMVSLISTAPGVTGLGLLTGGAPQSAPDNFSTEVQNNVNANGRSFDANLYVVDGLDVTSSVRPGDLNLSPNPDSVQEVAIQTNTYSVEYGRASSIVTAITTKSGTNQYHLSLSDYYTSQQLWARTEFTTKYLPFHSSNFAASLGGPIIKNHTFFFASLEPLRSTVSSTGVSTFEAPQFVSWAQANYPRSIGTSLLTNYPVNAATITGVAKTAQNVLGNSCGTSAANFVPCSLPMIDNGTYTLSPFRDGTQWSGRLDQYFHSDRIYANYYQTILSTSNPSIRAGMTTENHNFTRSLQLNETHTFSPSILSEAGFGYLQLEGITNVTGPFHVPAISISGQSTGMGVSPAHQDFVQHNYHWRNVLNIVRHTHTLKFGYEGFEGDELTLFAQQYNQPSFSFINLLSLVQDNPLTETGFVYNPVTGQPAFFNFGVATTTGGGFAQDEWKVTPHLTLTLGLRFDYFGNPHGSQTLRSVISNYDLGQGSTLAAQVASGMLKQTSNVLASTPTAFSPRVGAAWDPTGHGKWSVRGGFGVYHDWLSNGELTVPLRFNTPQFALPTFRPGTAQSPIFSLGAQDTFPYGYTVPTLPASTLNSQGGVVGYQLTIGATDPHLKEPSTYNYTIGLQRQIGSHFVVSGNYAGSQSRNLLWGSVNTITANLDVNRFAGDLVQNNNVLHRLTPSFGAVNYTFNGNKASYNAFIATVMGRFGANTFQASYTRTSTYDYGSQYPDVTNLTQYWGPASFEVPNRFSLTESIDLPQLRNRNTILRTIAGGWVVSGTVIAESGFPFTVYTSAPFIPVMTKGVITGLAPNSGDYNADGYNYDFPNVPSTGYSQPNSRQAFLSGLFPASSFSVPTLSTEGNELRNHFRGPGFAEWDAGVLKNFSLREHFHLQLRFELFNVLNHPNLNGVVSDLSSSSFGRSTATFTPRYLQIGAKLSF